MDYSVMVVSDFDLPAGVKRVMVEKRGSPPTLVLAESVMGNWNFLQEWERLYGGDHGRICLQAADSPGHVPESMARASA